ncbi:MAG: ABC transporter ATP-binding protein [Spirochaetota bacterium]
MSLEVKNVIKTYHDFKIDLAFSVEKGKLLTLLGPSGCGKTTTLHIIAGFITPDSGQIIINSRAVNHLPPYARNTGLVFQEYSLFPNMNVYHNIAFGLKMHNWSKKAARKRVEELLDLVHLPGYEKRTVTNLSGGEQQRIALARALAPNPQLLLLDEPLSALDARLRKTLRGEVKRIQRELGITTVYVTHDQEEALAISDKIAVMKDGTIEQTGTSFEVYNRPGTEFVAKFVGISNMIKARVKKVNSGGAVAENPLGKFVVRYQDGLEKDSEILIMVRPEKIRLKKSCQESNCLEAVVKNCEYLGDSTLLELRSGEHTFTAKIDGPVACRTEQRVAIGFSPDDCWVLANK